MKQLQVHNQQTEIDRSVWNMKLAKLWEQKGGLYEIQTQWDEKQ